jgi:putative intracellular protease/amidase
MNLLRHTALVFSALGCFCILKADTTSVATIPVGYMTVNIAGGTIAAPVTTRFAIPLVDTPQAAGLAGGPVASVTANTLTLASAGWADGALATAAFPYAVRILTGAQAGLTLLVTANTTDTVTVEGADLTTLGVVAGDRLQLVPVDTLQSLFGSDTLAGSTSAATADIVYLGSQSLLGYYYNTTLGRWVRTVGPTSDRSNIMIPPESMVTVARTAAATSLVFVGRVPEAPFVATVANAGNTYLHAGFPSDTTLGGLSMQTILPGWLSASTASQADQLAVPTGAGWLSYYHNGTQWVRTTGPALNRDTVSVPAGTALLISKQGFAAGTSVLKRPVPYSFD